MHLTSYIVTFRGTSPKSRAQIHLNPAVQKYSRSMVLCHEPLRANTIKRAHPVCENFKMNNIIEWPKNTRPSSIKEEWLFSQNYFKS